MSCTIPNINDLVNAVRNKTFTYKTSTSDTVEDIDVRLQDTQSRWVVTEDEHKYITVDGAVKLELESTITKDRDKALNKKAFTSEIDFTPYSDYGTYVHNTLEVMFKGEDYRAIDGKGFELSEDQYRELSEVKKNIISIANRRQKAINKKTGRNDSYKIYSEQKIVSAKKNRGGTIDLLIVFSDKTAMVFDFKTVGLPKIAYDKDGNVKSTYKIDNKIKEFKLQLSLIEEDLKSNYGVSEVVSSRIIPIAIRYKTKQVDGKFSIVRGVQPSLETPFTVKEGIASILEQLLLGKEKTGVRSIDSYISKVNKKIDEADKKGDFRESNKLRTQLNDIIIRNNYVKLAKLLEEKFEQVQTRLHEPEFIDGEKNYRHITDKELADLYQEVIMAKELSDDLSEYVRILSDIDYEGLTDEQALDKQEKINKIIEGINQFRNEVDLLKRDTINLMNQRIMKGLLPGTDFDAQGNIKPSRQDDVTNLYELGLNEKENTYFRAANELQKRSENKVRQEFADFMLEWRAVNAKLTSYMKGSRTAFINKVYNPKTQNLIPKLNSEFIKKINEARKNGDIKFLKDTFEPIYTLESYNKLLSDKEAFYERLVSKNVISRDQYSKHIERFKENNDLWSNNTKAWTNKKILKLKESAVVANYSNEYKAILGTPAQEFYDFYTKYMRKFLNYLDENKGSNFVAYIRQSMIEKFYNSNMDVTKVPANIRQAFIDTFSVHDTTVIGMQDEYGNKINSVPKFFLQPVLDPVTMQPVKGSEKSLDLMQSLALFGQMAINYKYLSETETIALSIADVLATEATVYKTNMRNNLIVNENGTPKEFKPDKLLIDVFNTYIDVHWYGVGLKTKDKSLGTMNGRDISLNQTLLNIKQWMTLQTLGLGIIPAAGSFISAVSNAYFEGKKGIYYNSNQYNHASVLMVKDRVKYLALGEVMDIYSDNKLEQEKNKGDLGATINVFKTGLFKKEYSDFFGNKINSRFIMSSWRLESELRDTNLVNAVAHNYGVDKEGNFVRFSKGMLDKNGYSLKKEYKDQGFTSMYDLFEYDHKAGTFGFKGITGENAERLYLKFRAALKTIKSGISGEMSDEDKIHANTFLLGRLLHTYKTWMPGIFRERFGRLEYRHNTMSAHEGRYISGFKYLLAKNPNLEKEPLPLLLLNIVYRIGKLLTEAASLGLISTKNKFNQEALRIQYETWSRLNPDLAENITLDYFVEMREGQVRALTAEIRMLLVFVMFLSFLKGIDDDDDEERSWANKKTYALTRKAYSELTFMWNPLEINKIAANPLPMSSYFRSWAMSLADTKDDLHNLIIPDEDYEYESLDNLIKQTPVVYQMNNLLDLNEVGEEYMQKQ